MRLRRLASDSLDERLSPEGDAALLTRRPHPDAVFDADYWSNYDPEPPARAWRFIVACEAGCESVVGSVSAVGSPRDDYGTCPDCGAPLRHLRRALETLDFPED